MSSAVVCWLLLRVVTCCGGDVRWTFGMAVAARAYLPNIARHLTSQMKWRNPISDVLEYLCVVHDRKIPYLKSHGKIMMN